MSSESVCQVARSWVDVGSSNTRLFIIFMILQRQSGIFWTYPRMNLLLFCKSVISDGLAKNVEGVTKDLCLRI
jgi:hypothetical protein